MTNPTSNFGWVMPDPTDLVTNLPADFEVFGQAVDTSMADLKGGTTGQILSKTSATDMDFTWIANDQGDITAVNVTAPITGGGSSGAVTIGVSAASTAAAGVVQLSDSTSTTSSVLAATPTAVKAAYDKASTAATTSVAGIVQLSDSISTTSSVLASTPTATKSAYDLATTANTTANAAIAKTTVTTAGDVIYRNATVPTRLGIGTAGQVLTVNSGATAPEWATASSGGYTLIQTITMTQASSSSASFTSIAGTYKHLFFTFTGWNPATNGVYLNGRLNNDSAANYTSQCINVDAGSSTIQTSRGETITFMNPAGLDTGIVTGGNSSGANWQAHGNSSLWVYNYADTTTMPTYEWRSFGYDGGFGTYVTGFGVYKSGATAVTRADFSSSTGNANCVVRLFGVK
jgi:hypothetical protein